MAPSGWVERTAGAGVGILLSAVREELVWIDCEMTGLDLRTDRLIEIAALVTDAELNVLGEGIDVVIHADDEALDGMIEVVAQMHHRSGLTEEVRKSTVDMAAAEQLVLDYIRTHVKAGQDRAAGREFHRHRSRFHRSGHARRWTTTCTTG